MEGWKVSSLRKKNLRAWFAWILGLIFWIALIDSIITLSREDKCSLVSPCSRQSLFDILTELLLLPGGEDPVDHNHDQPDEDEGQPNSQQSTPVGLDQTHVE